MLMKKLFKRIIFIFIIANFLVSSCNNENTNTDYLLSYKDLSKNIEFKYNHASKENYFLINTDTDITKDVYGLLESNAVDITLFFQGGDYILNSSNQVIADRQLYIADLRCANAQKNHDKPVACTMDYLPSEYLYACHPLTKTLSFDAKLSVVNDQLKIDLKDKLHRDYKNQFKGILKLSDKGYSSIVFTDKKLSNRYKHYFDDNSLTSNGLYDEATCFKLLYAKQVSSSVSESSSDYFSYVFNSFYGSYEQKGTLPDDAQIYLAKSKDLSYPRMTFQISVDIRKLSKIIPSLDEYDPSSNIIYGDYMQKREYVYDNFYKKLYKIKELSEIICPQQSDEYFGHYYCYEDQNFKTAKIITSEIVLEGGALKYFISSIDHDLAQLIEDSANSDAFWQKMAKVTEGAKVAASITKQLSAFMEDMQDFNYDY